MKTFKFMELASVLSVLIYSARDVAAQSFTIAQNYTGDAL